jgi:exonuclease VII large subunit
VTRADNGALVNQVGKVTTGDALEIRISDGRVDAEVKGKGKTGKDK